MILNRALEISKLFLFVPLVGSIVCGVVFVLCKLFILLFEVEFLNVAASLFAAAACSSFLLAMIVAIIVSAAMLIFALYESLFNFEFESMGGHYDNQNKTSN